MPRPIRLISKAPGTIPGTSKGLQTAKQKQPSGRGTRTQLALLRHRGYKLRTYSDREMMAIIIKSPTLPKISVKNAHRDAQVSYWVALSVVCCPCLPKAFSVFFGEFAKTPLLNHHMTPQGILHNCQHSLQKAQHSVCPRPWWKTKNNSIFERNQCFSDWKKAFRSSSFRVQR